MTTRKTRIKKCIRVFFVSTFKREMKKSLSFLSGFFFFFAFCAANACIERIIVVGIIEWESGGLREIEIKEKERGVCMCMCVWSLPFRFRISCGIEYAGSIIWPWKNDPVLLCTRVHLRIDLQLRFWFLREKIHCWEDHKRICLTDSLFNREQIDLHRLKNVPQENVTNVVFLNEFQEMILRAAHECQLIRVWLVRALERAETLGTHSGTKDGELASKRIRDRLLFKSPWVPSVIAATVTKRTMCATWRRLCTGQ